MTDKEKLKAEIVSIRNDKKSILKFRQYPFFILTLMKVCDYLLSFIDSMQEEPVSDSETVEAQNKEVYMKPHSEPIYLGIGGIPINAPKCLCKEECEYSKSDDFIKSLAECIHQAQGSVVDPMVFAELWKDELIKLAKSEEPVSEDLKEAANDYAVTVYNNYLDNPKAFENKDADTLNEDAFKAGAKWQKQQIKKSLDLGEPPYLISVEQAYYRTVKLLED